MAFTPNVKDVYGQNTEASDRSLSRRIRVLLAWNGPISVLRNNSFAGFAFGRSKLDPFDDNLAAADPAFEFIDAELEGLRAELTRTINALMEAIAEETYFSNANVEFSSVPAEYEITKPARFAAAVKRIHGAASDVCNAYDEFTRALRRKLGDEGVEPVPAAA